MRRWLFNLAATMSLVLCVGTVVSWSVTWRRSASAEYYFHSGSSIRVNIIDAHLAVEAFNIHPMPGDTRGGGGFSFETWEFESYNTTIYSHSVAGLSWGRYWSPEITNTYLGFPLSEVALFFSLLPATYVFLRTRTRGTRCNTCTHCGYNLTGNTSGICPECGTPVADTAGVKA